MLMLQIRTYYIKNINTLFIETQTSKKLENVYFTTMHMHTYKVVKLATYYTI